MSIFVIKPSGSAFVRSVRQSLATGQNLRHAYYVTQLDNECVVELRLSTLYRCLGTKVAGTIRRTVIAYVAKKKADKNNSQSIILTRSRGNSRKDDHPKEGNHRHDGDAPMSWHNSKYHGIYWHPQGVVFEQESVM